jgi:5-dehydro-2-deoxygluconokinase
MSSLHFPSEREIDIACLGRLAVDLYADQIGCALENASSFSKYLGGSSANIAFGCARLGLKSAMISRVGDEQMGRFLLNTLQKEGCSTEAIRVDPERLTGLVLLGLRDKETFPLLFYRENCADMALCEEDIQESFIQKCRSLLITGTHLSQPGVLAASLKALRLARQHGTRTVLDIDYRPVLWGLTKRGEGENRYVPNAQVSQALQAHLPHFDLLIGTEEEFLIAGGEAHDLIGSLKHIRTLSSAAFVVKRGPLGCALIEGDVPDAIAAAPHVSGKRVEVMNVLGAGDAFAAGLMTGLLEGLSLPEAAARGNACGALVVSRHGCAPAMPSRDELHYFQNDQGQRPAHLDQDLAHIHRGSVPRAHWSELMVLAVDHRSQMMDLARAAGADPARIAQLKGLVVDALAQVELEQKLQGRVGILVDGSVMGESALHKAMERGWWVGRPLELPGSRPLRFDGSLEAAQALRHWPLGQTVKCLCFYHPDDEASLRIEQERSIRALWEATRQSGHELLLEFIPPTSAQGVDAADAADAVYRTMVRFYNLGIKPEWWKLPPQSREVWQRMGDLIDQRDPYCRGLVILGLNAPLAALQQDFAQATPAQVKGFMVGRSIWHEPSQLWLSEKTTDAQLIEQVAHNFTQLVGAWLNRKNK